MVMMWVSIRSLSLLLASTTMPPNQGVHQLDLSLFGHPEDGAETGGDSRGGGGGGLLRCALLGCGMMGQEHCSYLMGYGADVQIDYLCDPHEESLQNCLLVMKEFNDDDLEERYHPTLLKDEQELLRHVNDIDLLVIASPNHLHTDQLLRWGHHPITILCEKPVAVSRDQLDRLQEFSTSEECIARIWVAMEYRYIPAITKLLSLIPSIGDIKMVTIRENRYPFLHKIGAWNRDRSKTGDTLVEKCCHFFDLFRLITDQEATLSQVRALAQRGLNYHDETVRYDVPIIDSAYVFLPFRHNDEADSPKHKIKTMGCLELCMYAEGSRHQEEIIVTGTQGRLEAYLPENKVYAFHRPLSDEWSDRTIPPPPSAIQQHVYDCSDVCDVHGIKNVIPTHGGYHYSSTAVEWYFLLNSIRTYEATGAWAPQVSLADGLSAVEIGLQATQAIVNEQENGDEDDALPFRHTHSTV